MLYLISGNAVAVNVRHVISALFKTRNIEKQIIVNDVYVGAVFHIDYAIVFASVCLHFINLSEIRLVSVINISA